jgi:hypothetical protein
VAQGFGEFSSGNFEEISTAIDRVAAFLGEGIFHGAFGFISGDDIVYQPFDEQVDTPIAGFEQASQAPLSDTPWTPTSQVVQGFASGIDGLHHDQPAEQKPVLAFPHAGHTSKDGGDEGGQVGQFEHGLSP